MCVQHQRQPFVPTSLPWCSLHHGEFLPVHHWHPLTPSAICSCSGRRHLWFFISNHSINEKAPTGSNDTESPWRNLHFLWEDHKCHSKMLSNWTFRWSHSTSAEMRCSVKPAKGENWLSHGNGTLTSMHEYAMCSGSTFVMSCKVALHGHVVCDSLLNTADGPLNTCAPT